MAPYGSMPAAMAADTPALTLGLAERERVIRIIRAHAAEIRARGVTRLSLFGSLARPRRGRAGERGRCGHRHSA
jgi:hypothetical protein